MLQYNGLISIVFPQRNCNEKCSWKPTGWRFDSSGKKSVKSRQGWYLNKVFWVGLKFERIVIEGVKNLLMLCFLFAPSRLLTLIPIAFDRISNNVMKGCVVDMQDRFLENI